MRAKWQSLTASQFCASVRDGTHDSPKPVERGRFLVTSRHIIGGRIDLNNAYHISQEDYDSINNRSKVDKWDVLISMIGTVGEPCLIKEEPNYTIKNIGLFKSKSEENGKWLYYYLRSPETQQMIRERLQGTTQQYIPLGALRDFPIFVPTDREEQKAIVHILGTLDDKIELNRRMNETLEAMARALFKAWFVDFEPVRAKLEGRWRRGQSLPGLPAHLYDLFPDRLVESELGEIPEGWDLGVLGDVLSLRNERTQASNVASTLPYVPIECINAKNPFLSLWMDGSEAKSSLILFKRGDILFGAMRPYFHKVCIAPFDGVTRTTVFTLKANQPIYSAYALMLAFQTDTVEYATLHSEGSTIPYAKWKDSFEKMPIVLAPKILQKEFSRLVNSFLEQANSNIQHSRLLTELRDTLLPKLFSGELRVGTVEAMARQGV